MANVFANLIRPVPTVLDYMGQMEELDRSTLQRQQAMQQMQERTRALQQAEQERNALSGLIRQSGGDQNKLIGLLESSGVPSFYQQAQGYRKAGLDARKAESDIAKDTATAARTTQQTSQANRSDALAQLQMLNTPDDARASLSAAVSSGKLPMQEATRILQAIPQEPQAFAQWKQQMMLAAASPDKAAEITFKDGSTADWKDYQKAVSQGYSGQFIDYQREMANLKAPKTTNVVNTGQKGLDNERGLRSDFRSEQIVKDYNEMLNAHKQIKAALAAGTPIGDTAGATKIMKLLDPGSVVRESELGMAMAASGRMDRMRNFIDMQLNGTKLTPTQRQEFAALADELMAAAGSAYNQKRQEYIEWGDRYKLDTSVLGPEWSRTTSKPPAKPKPGAAPSPAAAAPAPAAPTVLRFDANGNPI